MLCANRSCVILTFHSSNIEVMNAAIYGAAGFGMVGAILIAIGFNDFCQKSTRLWLSIIGCVFIFLAFALIACAVYTVSQKLHKMHWWLNSHRNIQMPELALLAMPPV